MYHTRRKSAAYLTTAKDGLADTILKYLHLRIHGKPESNIKMLAESFKRLMRTDRPEIMNTPVACWVGHAVGPLWYYSEGYSIRTNAINIVDNEGIRKVNFEKLKKLLRGNSGRT